MKQHDRFFLKTTAALALIATLTACESINRHISGDSGMRIQVDVYKGPLSLDPEIQWDRLQGQFGEASTALDLYIASLEAVISKRAEEDQVENKKSSGNDSGQQKGTQPAATEGVASIDTLNFNNTKAESAYLRLTELLGDAREARNLVSLTQNNAMIWTKSYDAHRIQVTPHLKKLLALPSNAKSKKITALNDANTKLKEQSDALSIKLIGDVVAQRKSLRGLLSQFVQAGTRLENKATYWSWVQSIDSTSDLQMRQLLVGFTILVSEYANRIISASDALLKQTYLADRRELPISSMIRDSQPTYASKFLVFNRAAGENQRYVDEDISYDRLRAMEQLYGDNSWANINQAYASGRGDTAMAFVKDDVGNWNLKNFDQDPSELVRAYKGMGLAVMNTALKLAKTATTGDSADVAKKMFSLGDRLTMGGADMGEPAEVRQINSLNKAAVRSLEAILTRHDEQEKAITTRHAAAPTGALPELSDLSKKTAAEVAGVLDAHNRIITVLEEGIVEAESLIESP